MLGPIAQIAVPAIDLDESRRFYAEVLGLPALFAAPNVAAFQAGDLRILLTHQPDYVTPDKPGVLLYFKTGDLPAIHAELLTKGADDAGTPHVVAKMGNSEIWIGFISDPTGTIFGLIEERQV